MDTARGETRERFSGTECKGTTDQISIIGDRSSFKNYYSTWNTDDRSEESVQKIPTSTNHSENHAIPISSSEREHRITSSQNTDTSTNDPHDYSKMKNPTGFYGTIFHLVIISAGPAMLTLPKIYFSVGTVFGIFGTLFIIALYNHCCHIFIECEYKLCKREKMPTSTYPDVIYQVFHESPGYFKSIAIYVKYFTYLIFGVPWLGSNSLNIILIAENLQMICELYSYEVSTYTIMLYSFIPLLVLCWIPNLKYLVPISILGNILNFLVVLIVIYHIFLDDPISSRYAEFEDKFDFFDFPLFFGSILYCVSAMAILMPLKNEMRQPERFGCTWGVLNISNFFIAFTYAAFNVLCCLKYGPVLRDNVVMNLPQDEFATKLTIIMFVTALCFQFPLVSYTVFDLLWNIILREEKSKFNYLILYEYVVRTVVVIGAYVAAIAIPSIQFFITISGTLATSADALIFPCVVQQLLAYNERKKFFVDKIFVKDLLIICIGFGLMCSGLISVLNQAF